MRYAWQVEGTNGGGGAMTQDRAKLQRRETDATIFRTWAYHNMPINPLLLAIKRFGTRKYTRRHVTQHLDKHGSDIAWR